MKETLEERYKRLCNTGSDINLHLPTLRQYSAKSQSVLELGVCMANSTTALLAGQPEWMISIDTCWQPTLKELYPPDVVVEERQFSGTVGRTRWKFFNENDLTIGPYAVDLTFIDTWHCYRQMEAELDHFAPFTQKWIICHDTTTFCWLGERISPDDPVLIGIGPAICEYLYFHPEWKIKECRVENNGLLVLEKI